MALLSAKPRFEQSGLTVPFVTAWEYEKQLFPKLGIRVTHEGGPHLTFADENPMDRDQHGVLWVRQGLARGKGKALFPKVHAFRQRRAMFDLLCQVCGGQTIEESFERQLYVMNSAKGTPIKEGELTTAAPVCQGCAPEAAMSCPRLKDRYVAAYADYNYPWGVAGVLINPHTLEPVSLDPVQVSFGDPQIKWMIANMSVNRLSGIRYADLKTFALVG
ncbi:hypothetical protein [Streptomyces yunnanensis]|uniref:Uncharacterized protein n=1 Tax=Streptomyces yunnanensis TaxID=156453 RepID=A0A9X8QZJ4_9ACTN|nr:hypothetical protein [Streptomyces yunnanensis]SHN24106.1 hypothetical protein SAMN05216268_12666 [Streptomyces yunnanensis]